jgi:hypothetical protein
MHVISIKDLEIKFNSEVEIDCRKAEVMAAKMFIDKINEIWKLQFPDCCPQVIIKEDQEAFPFAKTVSVK